LSMLAVRKWANAGSGESTLISGHERLPEGFRGGSVGR
jgi:hypothetical protein